MSDSNAAVGAPAAKRRFTVGDALIVMGAFCLALAGIRDRVRTLPWRAYWWLGEYRRFRAEAASLPPMSDEDYHFGLRSLEYYVSDEFQTWLTSILIALVLAQLLMRLRPPRPPWPELFRQPGFAGSLAALFGFCIDKGFVPFPRFESAQFPFVTALSVLIAWAALLEFPSTIRPRSAAMNLVVVLPLLFAMPGADEPESAKALRERLLKRLARD